jgi:hypothetical protein
MLMAQERRDVVITGDAEAWPTPHAAVLIKAQQREARGAAIR